MKKPDIKRLRYPLWFHIVFYCLTVLIPLILIMVEGFSSHVSYFKWTFGVLALLVLTWSAIYKWLLSGMRKRIEERKHQLEHDYEIDVGNPEKIRYIWFTNEQKLVIAVGIAEGFMAIKGATICIAALYVIAYVIKFLTITFLKGYEKGDKNNGETKQ